jgi:hypothetical protein
VAPSLNTEDFELQAEVATADRVRAARLVDRLIDEFKLDLSGFAVFTEAASGAYLWTPLIAARAGARRVYAITRDSSYGAAADVERDTGQLAVRLGVADKIKVVRTRSREDISDCDIFTNSGFVRPINAALIEWMKPTAVV